MSDNSVLNSMSELTEDEQEWFRQYCDELEDELDEVVEGL